MNPVKRTLSTLRDAAGDGVRALQNQWRQRQEAPDYVWLVLDGGFPELPPPAGEWWQRLLPRDETSLHTLRRRFEAIAGDERVRGVVLHLRALSMPLAHLQTLRDLIGTLRAANKRVVVWALSYDTATYYVASAADEILMQPGGMVQPLGVNRTVAFLADTLEEIGVETEAVRISPYKSAPEIFTRRDFTEEAREQTNWLTDAAFEDLVMGIAGGRGLSDEAARALVDGSPYTDVAALDAGAVDGLLHEEALPAHLRTDEGPATLQPWEKAGKVLLRPRRSRADGYVALLRIEGAIVPGQSRRPPMRPPIPLPIVPETQAGDLSVVQAARAVLDDERAAAVVLFIESPGGSADASEAMAAALERVAAEKPLVVAMGAVAASGGYYVATPARWIIAQPGTITGSVGVYALRGNVSRLLDKLRLGREKFTRGEHVTLFDPDHPLTEAGRERLEESIQRTYQIFVERVAASRNMSVEAVDAVGGGRVWTGRQALDRGLVDELGGLDAALAKARSLAGLPADAPWREVRPGKQPRAPQANRREKREERMENRE